MSTDTRDLSARRGTPSPRIAAARRRADLVDRVATALMSAAALLLVLVLFAVIFIILRAGLPAINWTFLTTGGSFAQEGGGIGPQIFVSVYILILSLLITTPLGVAAAIYMSEYARPGRLTSVIRFSIEALSSVPSIVFGVFGAVVFLTVMNLGFSLLSGALTLALLNLPLMTRIAEDSIRAVPESYREASLALAG
ncbi:MAG: ABC transporter permease subunit, partial [Roseiflexaceae bacterium]